MYQHQISTRAQVYYFFCRIFHSAAMGTHGEQTMVWRICIFLIKPNKESFDLCGGTLSSQVRRLRARMYTALRPKVGRNSGQNPFRVNPWIITHVGQSLPNELGQKGRGGEKKPNIYTRNTFFHRTQQTLRGERWRCCSRFTKSRPPKARSGSPSPLQRFYLYVVSERTHHNKSTIHSRTFLQARAYGQSAALTEAWKHRRTWFCGMLHPDEMDAVHLST